jgi:hypothetical protein
MKLPLDILATEEDSPEYLELVRGVVQGMVRDRPPEDIWLVRVDNWFGKKWCGFVGKVMGAFGVARTDRLVVPPFVPARIEDVQYLRAVVGGYRSEPSLAEVHREQSSESNATRFIDEMTDDGLLVWYAGRSAKNKRGSLMAYRVRPAEQWGWHAELRERAGRWSPSSLVGVSPTELATWTGRSVSSFQKSGASPEWPTTTSLELRGIVDAFRTNTRSLSYSDRWTCEHSTEDGERLDIDFQGNADVRLSFWPDGKMWVRACRRAKGSHPGWAFIWAFHGSWADIDPQLLVEMYKASKSHLRPTPESEVEFLGAWGRVTPLLDPNVHRSVK